MINGLKNIKLGLLGIAAAAIPILFIFQADDINSKKEDIGKQKMIADSIAAVNFKQSELIDFFKSEIAKKNPSDSGRSLISFNPTISIPKPDNSEVSSSIDDLRRSVDEFGKLLLSGKTTQSNNPNVPQESKKGDTLNYKIIADTLNKLNIQLIKTIDNLIADRKNVDEQLISICSLNGNRNKKNTLMVFTRLDSLCNSVLQRGYQYYRNYPIR